MAFVETNYTALVNRQAMFRLKEDLKAQGWAVAISSDGSTYNGSGDQITLAASGAGGIDNANVHFLLRRTGAPDWLFVRGGTSDIWNVYASPSGAFSGGNATTRPTAGDEVIQFSTAYTLFSGAYDTVILVEDTAPYRWAMRSTFDTFVAAIGGTARPVIVFNNGYGQALFHNAPGDEDAWLDVAEMLNDSSGGGGGPSDTTDPTISAFTPTGGSSIARADTIAVDVADETALEHVGISAELADGTVLQVYDGSAFVGPFAASSTLVSDTYTIEHDAPGWPSSTVDLHVVAVDTSGNSATATGSFTITDAPAAPTVGPFSPSDGGNTTRTGTVTIDVTDDEGRTAIKLVTIAVTLADGTTITAYNGAAFPGALTAGSSRSDITNGYRYTLVHASPGWASSALTYRITAVDTQGRITTHTSYNLVITDPPAPADATAPTVALVSPSAPGEITRATPIIVDVTDTSALVVVFVWVTYPGRAPDIVHDGDAFAELFSSSTRASISGGYRYTLRRNGGWPAAPTVRIRPIDAAGNTP